MSPKFWVNFFFGGDSKEAIKPTPILHVIGLTREEDIDARRDGLVTASLQEHRGFRTTILDIKRDLRLSGYMLSGGICGALMVLLLLIKSDRKRKSSSNLLFVLLLVPVVKAEPGVVSASGVPTGPRTTDPA